MGLLEKSRKSQPFHKQPTIKLQKNKGKPLCLPRSNAKIFLYDE
jgi:hypothetical protein